MKYITLQVTLRFMQEKESRQESPILTTAWDPLFGIQVEKTH